MASAPVPRPDLETDDDPAVYTGRRGPGLTPFVAFLVATFWLCVIGGVTLFFSGLWGAVILGVAAVTLFAAFLTAG